jgi:hypothetical protein
MNPNKSSLALPLLLTFIFVSCLLGVYFYQQSQINSLTSRLISPTPTPALPSPTLPAKASATTIPTNSTSTWQTYKNDQYGFELKYPQQYINKNENSTYISSDYLTSIYSSDYKVTNETLGPANMVSGSAIYNIYADSKSCQLPKIDNHILNKKETLLDNNVKAIILDIKNIATSSITIICGSTTEECINNSKLNNEFTQILSTFKFTTPTTDTSGLKTYKNDQYGFEFQYPVDWSIENDYDTTFRLLSPETRKNKSTAEHPGLSQWYDIELATITQENLPKYLDLGLKSISDITSSKYSDYFENSQSTTFASKIAAETYEQGECRYYSIFVDNPKSFLKISFPCNQSKENLTLIQKQILSTFKFIN